MTMLALLIEVYSNTLVSSDVSWYHDTFGVMHRYSYALYCPISNSCTTFIYAICMPILHSYHSFTRFSSTTVWFCFCVVTY